MGPSEAYFDHLNYFPPPVKRAAYSDRTAWIMAKCSEAAYRSGNELYEKLASGKFVEITTFNNPDTDTQAFLAFADDFAVLAFRGTEKNLRDIWTDLNARFYRVRDEAYHDGFAKAYLSVKEQIQSSLEEITHKPLYITGHSLGGALATLAALDLERDSLAACYTFGSPRVGSTKLDWNIKCPVYRVVNATDIVARMPLMLMGYRHVGSLYYLTRKANLLRSPHAFRMIHRFVWSTIRYLTWLATLPFSRFSNAPGHDHQNDDHDKLSLAPPPLRDHGIRHYVTKLDKIAEERQIRGKTSLKDIGISQKTKVETKKITDEV